MSTLNRDSILGFDDVKVIKVAVPAWGNSEVYLKTLTAGERDQMEKLATAKEGVDHPRSRLVVLSLCDEAGALLFKADEYKLLAEKNAAAMDFLFHQVCKLNAMGDSGAAEEVAKNSEPIPGGDSITA